MHFLVQCAGLVGVFFFAVLYLRFARRGPHEPPGPRQLPFLGNLLDFPEKEINLGLTRLAEKYGKTSLLLRGPIMKLSTPTSCIVVLSNATVTTELLGKRGSISSDRDVAPALKYLPRWFSGASFQQFARESRKCAEDMLELPFAQVKRDIENGISNLSMVTELLALASEENEVRTLKEAAGAMYLGGTDTTSTALRCFFLAMTMNPSVLCSAQKEIDHVVGPNRLPTLADRQSLPYVEAIVREVYRMYTVVPLSMPDDIYEELYIGKGTTLVANMWAIMHDSDVYSDPYIFNPERFLRDGHIDNNILDPKEHIFGYGRRICPGRYFADSSLFISIALVLYCFNVRKKIESPPPSGKLEHGGLM